MFFKKMGQHPASFSFIFGIFKQKIITIFTTKKWDLNPRPSVRESLPITTRPWPI